MNLKEILEQHSIWLSDYTKGKKANLRWADMQWADMQGTNLQGADLQGANLQGANLQGANLQGANLQGTDMRWANLQEANLQGANMQGTNLQGANLQGAKLPSPAMVLLARWENISDDLTVQLMRLDAWGHPEGQRAFTEWAKGGPCPYKDCRYQRIANFKEKKELWSPGQPKSLYTLADAVLGEKCILGE